MSEEGTNLRSADAVPKAQVQTKRTFSVIWVVPIVALIIGGWLAYKAMSEKGPEITITFETAEGLEANKTKIKFKDVDVGTVTQIELDKDLKGVIVKAEMQKDVESFLTENTDFWVVRARVAAGEVSGLSTLFSGAYIGCSPSMQGKPQSHFTGLEKPPIVTEGQPGRHFVLAAKDLGSLDLGSPVYYRGIKVGQVVSYDFDEQAETVLLKVFINAPYHEKVRTNSRFWNASGIDMTMDATGVNINTQSLVSIVLGGVAFDLRQHDQPGVSAAENARFKLYQDHQSSKEDTYDIKRYYLLYFDQNVRGLEPGAPVEIKGIQVGEVVNVELQFDLQDLDFRIPVLVFLEPERIHSLVNEEGEIVKEDQKENVIEEESSKIDLLMERTRKLIEKGFRAQLKTGNLITGKLYIDLDFYSEAQPTELKFEEGYPVFPTMAAPLEQIVHRVDNILKKVEQVPFDLIGKDLQSAVKELTATLEEIRTMSGAVNQETIPKINAALDEMQQAMQGVESTLGPDSALNYNARKLTSELSVVIRSVRSLLEYLERDPQALILGKEKDKP